MAKGLETDGVEAGGANTEGDHPAGGKAAKVLQLCMSDGKGGMELYVDRVIEDLHAEGVEVIGICLRQTRIETYFQRHGVAFKAFSSNLDALKNAWRIRRWLIDENVRIVHCHKSSDLRLTALLKLLLPNLRVLYTDHVGGQRAKKSPYHRFAYRNVDYVLSISQATHARNVNNLPVPRERVICLPHGVNIDTYHPVTDRASIAAKRAELGIPESAVAIGLPGRVTPGKGQDVWVKALLALPQELDFFAVSIGGTDYASGGTEEFYQTLVELIDGTPLADKIRFLGHRSDLTEILPVLDLVCIPSENEAFGLTIIESMACAMPIIGSNTGSLPELVDKDSGVLVGPFDIDAWQRAMAALIEDDARRRAMGAAARTRVERHFSNRQHVKRLMGYYDALA
ncbi:glycosyltransferase family 4 protein [Halomonas sp. GD1P12]|uniref:glycosyltransferase family 4 protein n=1 Tax=Halomonas sp. GD1P12 TaxID=2982691 RepID=UPI0021E36733|nr:glycosyltransferase family 4 protein [Halomonas sp. GD1P12]UYF99986.1 glycosyltransferase family 4 protein [Halomonas sp. GD1P12]